MGVSMPCARLPLRFSTTHCASATSPNSTMAELVGLPLLAITLLQTTVPYCPKTSASLASSTSAGRSERKTFALGFASAAPLSLPYGEKLLPPAAQPPILPYPFLPLPSPLPSPLPLLLSRLNEMLRGVSMPCARLPLRFSTTHCASATSP